MTQQDYRHPIAPPPELAMQWIKQLFDNSDDPVQSGYLLIKVAAQYGADQELEACVKWLEWNHSDLLSRDLRTARRPEPPSLKQEALEALSRRSTFTLDRDRDTIRRALEQLDG